MYQGRFFAGRKGWKPHPRSGLLVLVKRKEHLLCNKESRHCSIQVVPSIGAKSKANRDPVNNESTSIVQYVIIFTILERTNTYQKGSMCLTFGACGISIKRELAKKDILLLASRFVGTSIADSFTVSRR